MHCSSAAGQYLCIVRRWWASIRALSVVGERYSYDVRRQQRLYPCFVHQLQASIRALSIDGRSIFVRCPSGQAGIHVLLICSGPVFMHCSSVVGLYSCVVRCRRASIRLKSIGGSGSIRVALTISGGPVFVAVSISGGPVFMH